MPLIPITAPDDPRVAPFADLRDRQSLARYGRFIVEGDLVVNRLLVSDYEVESLLIAEDQLHHVAFSPEMTVYCAPRRLMEELAGFGFHRGILACARRPAPQPLDDWLPPGDQPVTVVVCAAIQDPENLGGIFRNCAALGVRHVLLGEQSADPLSRRVLRVSMGTVLKLAIRQTPDLAGELPRLREEFRLHLAATVLDPTAPLLATAPCPHRLALLLGNERNGLEPEVVQACDSRWTIPMRSGTDSLNVAVASGIFLYHFSCERDVLRQGNHPGEPAHPAGQH
jgi:tRNA G18 (ribose-2'-O)-methylase SpoU